MYNEPNTVSKILNMIRDLTPEDKELLIRHLVTSTPHHACEKEKEQVQYFPVKDGEVKLGDYCWWHYDYGTIEVKVTETELENIKAYPQYYSIEYPSNVRTWSIKEPKVQYL